MNVYYLTYDIVVISLTIHAHGHNKVSICTAIMIHVYGTSSVFGFVKREMRQDYVADKLTALNIRGSYSDIVV